MKNRLKNLEYYNGNKLKKPTRHENSRNHTN